LDAETDTEREKCAATHMAIMEASHQSAVMGDLETSAQLERIIYSRLKLADCDAEEACRALRQVTPRALLRPQLQQRHIAHESGAMQDVYFGDVPHSSPEVWRGSDMENSLAVAMAKQSCWPLLDSGSLESWWRVRELFVGQSVIIIGSGLGGCATSALAGGALSVAGLDLRTDVPMTSAGAYIPPLVAACINNPNYVQLQSNISITSDWEDAGVAEEVVRECVGASLIVVDYTSSREDWSPYQPILRVSDSGWQGMVVTRLKNTLVNVNRMLATFSQLCRTLEFYTIFAQTGACEVVVVLHNLRPRPVTIYEPALGYVVYHQRVPNDLSCPRDQLLGWVNLLRGYTPGKLPPTKTVLQDIIDTVDSEIGLRNMRERYQNWTTSLEVMYTCLFLMESMGVRVQILRRIIENRSVEVKENVRLTITDRYYHVLVRYALYVSVE
jgi:hypothetical protein